MYLFLPIVYLSLVATLSTTCSDDDLYVIRSAAPSGLVLDATDPTQIKIQHFNGFSTQLWKFERAPRPGLYYIINSYSGKVLDFESRDFVDVVLSERTNTPNQQWSLTLNGRIVNVAKKFKVDIYKQDFTPGVHVILWNDSQSVNEEFVLEKKV